MKTAEKTNAATITALDGRSLRGCQRIASEVFEENASERQAIRSFWSATQSGFTARLNGRIVGFALCTGQNPDGVEIQAFAVEKKYRRNGIGRTLLDKVVRLSRRKVIVRVDDRALEAHLFLRDRGFRAVQIERGTFHDRYVFEGGPVPEMENAVEFHSP